MAHAQFRQYKPPKRPKKPRHELGWWAVLQSWLPIILLVLLIAAAVQCWKLATAPGTLPFKHVRVEASYTRISPVRLKQVIGQNISEGFFALDVAAFKQRLAQQLPWIQSIMVRRIWPSTLQLVVHERKAIAVWDARHLVSDQDVLFTPALASFPKGLPQLSGPLGSFDQVLDEFRHVQKLLGLLNLSVKKLALTDREAWHLQLSNGLVVMLGRDDVNKRLMRFVKVYPELLAAHPNKMQAVDLRYPNGIAVK